MYYKYVVVGNWITSPLLSLKLQSDTILDGLSEVRSQRVINYLWTIWFGSIDKVAIYLPSGEIAKAWVPNGWGSNMVFLGVPVFASHTTSMESGPISAVTIISSALL